MTKTKYYRWRLRKVIQEAQKKSGGEFVVLAKSQYPQMVSVYIFVLSDEIYVQLLWHGHLLPPAKCKNIEEAIDRVARWLAEHPTRWRIIWRKNEELRLKFLF